MWKLGYEQARGCNEADSLKSGNHMTHRYQLRGMRQTPQDNKKAYPRKRKANMYQELENMRLDSWMEIWGHEKA